MQVKANATRTHSTQDAGPVDLAKIRRKFGKESPPRLYCINATSAGDPLIAAASYDEDDIHYWGTGHDWRVVNDESLSSDELEEVSQYLLSSGQASI